MIAVPQIEQGVSRIELPFYRLFWYYGIRERKVIAMMTYQDIIKRLGGLDIRDAEDDDYVALYVAIELLKKMSETEKVHNSFMLES